ncbi:MAG: hypothetical protein AAF830_13950 [Pseudomonadota bacterium]
MPIIKPNTGGSVMPYLLLLHIFSVALSGIWLASWLGSDGLTSATDILLTVFLSASLLIALYCLSHFGVNKIPELTGRLRTIGFTIWILSALAIGATSMLTSAATLSGPRGISLHQERYVSELSPAFSERGNLTRAVENLQFPTGECVGTAEDAAERETNNGEISREGSGRGQTTRELFTIRDACGSAGAVIVKARPTTAPLFKEAERLMVLLRRSVENPEISQAEKDEILLQGSERMAEIEDALVAALSLPALDAAAEVMMKDFSYIGLSSDAVRYLESTFRPIARQILTVHDEAAIVLDRPFPTYRKVDSLGALTRYPQFLWPAITFAGVLEVVPLIIVAFSILMTIQRTRET